MSLHERDRAAMAVLEVIREQRKKGNTLSLEAIGRIMTDANNKDVKRKERNGEDRELNQRADGLYVVFKKFAGGGVVNPDGNAIQKLLVRKITDRQPISLYMFWGASDKHAMDDAEFLLFKKLTHMAKELSTQHPHGVGLEIIFGDVHVINNGYIDPSTGDLGLAQVYFEDVHAELGGGNTYPINSVVYLSDLYRQYNIDRSFPYNYLHDPYTESVFERHRHWLVANAESFNQTEETPQEAARRYMITRMREQPILAMRYSDSILIATGRKTGASDIILPEGMPGVFLGNRAPWFQRA